MRGSTNATVAAHTIFQQSLVACLVGMVIGYIAVQTGSLWPGMLFHAVHNCTGLLVRQWLPATIDEQQPLAWLVRGAADGPLYRWPVRPGLGQPLPEGILQQNCWP